MGQRTQDIAESLKSQNAMLPAGQIDTRGDRVMVRENVNEIEDYLQAADLGLFTSETESFCLSILEAMFFGCPSKPLCYPELC